jgi:hypothetical protein
MFNSTLSLTSMPFVAEYQMANIPSLYPQESDDVAMYTRFHELHANRVLYKVWNLNKLKFRNSRKLIVLGI